MLEIGSLILKILKLRLPAHSLLTPAMTDSDTLPFYNYLGQIKYLSGYPLSFGDWSPSTGEPVSTEQQSLIDDISRILRKSPTESHIRAEDINLASN